MGQPKENNVSFDCTPKQARMLYELADVDEILWGGQAGGGKSEGLLLFCLIRRLQCPKSIGILFRRTVRDLEKSLIRKTKNGQWSKYAKWNEEKKAWLFPNGSIQEFGYIEHDNDLMNYDSAEYDDIGFDQLEHFPEHQYSYMKSRLRSMVGGTWKTLIRCSCNPGKIGHRWIKARFVDLAKETIYKEWDEDLKRYKTRYFLPASLDDNTLMSAEKKAEYRSWLHQMREEDRRRLADGDWDYIPGAAFSEWDRKIHVTKPMPIPEWAKITMAFDFGFGKPFCCLWFWTDYDGRAYLAYEWYGWNGKPDEGVRMAPSGIAKGIIEREESWGLKGKIYNRIADPSIFAKTPNIRGGGQGPSIAELMSNEGIFFNPGDNDRILGKQQFHERLKVYEDDLPLFMVYDTCIHFLRTVPVLQVDEDNIEDINTDMEDHPYDTARYFFMSRPVIPHRMQSKTDRYKIKKQPLTTWMAR